MLSFESFTQVRDCEDFTQRLTKATEGYADFMQIGGMGRRHGCVVDGHQIFKVVINPDGKQTVAFVAGLHGDEPGGPMEAKAIWDALEDEDLTLLHSLHEDPDLSSFYLYYTHNKKLAEEMRELAKKYFKIYKEDERKPIAGEMYGDKIIDGLIPLPHTKRGTIEDRVLEFGVPYFTTETPGKAPLSKRANFTKEVMKLVIHSI